MDLESRTFSIGTWATLAVVTAALVYLAYSGQWLGVAVLSGTIVTSLVFIYFEDWLPRVFNLLFVLAAAVNAGAYAFDLWDRIGVYDEFVHTYTTFAGAAAFGYLLFSRSRFSASSVAFMAAVTGFGLGVGILWEAFEWMIGIIGDTIDTLVDLVMDTVGSVLAGLFCGWAHQRTRDQTLLSGGAN